MLVIKVLKLKEEILTFTLNYIIITNKSLIRYIKYQHPLLGMKIGMITRLL